jgi:hypothetical protein
VQGRSAIRRSRRGDDRESRALRRRAAILNDVSPGHTDPLLARLQNARPGTTEIWVTNSRGGNTAIAYPGVEVDTRERPVRNFREAVGWRESQREAAQAPPERGSNANRGTEEQTEQPNSYETEQPYSYDAAHPYTYRRSDIVSLTPFVSFSFTPADTTYPGPFPRRSLRQEPRFCLFVDEFAADWPG